MLALFKCVCVSSGNAVTMPGVNGEEVSVPSTNRHFEYETVEKLEEALELQYGQVGPCNHCLVTSRGSG